MVEKKKSRNMNKNIPERESGRKLTPVEVFVGNNGMLIKIASIVLLAAFILVLFSVDNVNNVNLSEVKTALEKNTDIANAMKKMDNRDLMHFMSLNANDYDQVLYYRNTTALSVDELLIVKSNNKEQLDAAATAVETRIDSQIKVYESYGPEQCALLKNAIRTKKGEYYYYCTSEKAEKYEEVLLDVIQ